jgi:flagellar protein FliL
MVEEENSVKDTKTTSKRSSLSLYVLITVIVQGVLTFCGFYFLGGQPTGEPKEEELDSHAADHYDDAEEEKEETEELEEGEEILGAIYPLDLFLVNLKDQGVIRIEVQLQFIDRDIPHRLHSRMPLLRDTIISIVSQKNRKDLLETKGRETLRQDIKKLVNDRLMKELVKGVLFTQYIVQ